VIEDTTIRLLQRQRERRLGWRARLRHDCGNGQHRFAQAVNTRTGKFDLVCIRPGCRLEPTA
jgi:hypothetical protein